MGASNRSSQCCYLGASHSPRDKKKWSDLKVVVKKRICAHRRSVVTTGGGQGITDLSAFDARVGAIIGETGLSGVLPEFQGDTDVICGDDGK